MPSHGHTNALPILCWLAGSTTGTESVPSGNTFESRYGIINAAGGSGSHTHSLNTTSSSTTSTGSGTAVSIVQSYYTVYTWTRTV